VLPDSIGHRKFFKPSDGMHVRFPKYGYDDMVAAQYVLLTQGLHVDHLRLLLGTSMGCMHALLHVYSIICSEMLKRPVHGHRLSRFASTFVKNDGPEISVR
jgi:homoserine acetyltransferase